MLEAFDFIVKGSLLNVSDCIAIKNSMKSYIEGGDLIVLRDRLDYYYRLSFINAGMYYRLIELAKSERKERAYMLVDIKISNVAQDKEQKPREIKSLEAEFFFTDALREIVSSYEEDFPGIVHKYNAEYIESYKKLYVNDELFDLLTKVNDFMLKTARQH